MLCVTVNTCTRCSGLMVRALDFALCLSPGKLGSFCGVATQHPVVQRVDNTMLWTSHCHGQVLAKQTTLSTRKCVAQCVVSSMLKTTGGKCIYPPMQGIQLCMMCLWVKDTSTKRGSLLMG